MTDFADFPLRRAYIRCAPLLLLAVLCAATLGAQATTATDEHPATAAFVRQLGADPSLNDARFVRESVHPRGFTFVAESTMVRQLGLMRRTSGGLRIVNSERRGAATWMRARAENGAGAV